MKTTTPFRERTALRIAGLALFAAGLLAVRVDAAGAQAAAPAAEPASSPTVRALAQDISSAISVPGWSNDAWGVRVTSLDHGDVLYDHRGDATLMPASNMKLFTSAGALYYLGPNYRYGTFLVSLGRIRNGVLEGDLVLYGTGDPTLADRYLGDEATVWEAFADTLRALGVREVQGDVVGDASFFGGIGTGTGWQESYINAWYAAPAGALTYNNNLITLKIDPAEQAGWRPDITRVPESRGVAMVNLASTVAGGRRTLEVTRVAYDGPILIRGELPMGSGTLWRSVPVADPARYAAATFRSVLEARGIAVRGEIRSIHRPEASPFTERRVFAPAFAEADSLRVLAVHRSPRMQEILAVLNGQSHNLYAEQVLRTVGRVVLGAGTVEAGERAIELMLARTPEPGSLVLEMDDGSGLSVLNGTSAHTLTALLALMAKTPLFDEYFETLPEAGGRGLRRMGGSAAAGNLRAKTGTINNVSALSGYVTAANGERLVFSIISNGVPSTWRAKRVEDRIGSRLAAFSRPPPPAAPSGTAPSRPADAPPATDTAGAMRGDTAGRPAPDTASIAPPDTTPSAARTHVIRPGDTLDGIARQYGTTVTALQEANPGLNPRRLIPGRQVNLP